MRARAGQRSANGRQSTDTNRSSSYGGGSEKGESDREDGPTPVEDSGKRLASFRTRTASTVAMIAAFAYVVYLGHVPLVLLVLTLQFLMVKELFHLARVAQKENRLPGFRAQQWWFFAVATFYMYVRLARSNLVAGLAGATTTSLSSGGAGAAAAAAAAAAAEGAAAAAAGAGLGAAGAGAGAAAAAGAAASAATTAYSWHRAVAWVLRRHTLLCYLMYLAGFISFVLSLKRGMYLYQFGQYAWTHMILLTVLVPSSFFVSNVFEGLIWFLLPSALIIVNDILAYLAGFFFGRTPLIRLSPKKTWEGFIGGAAGTVVSAYFLAAWLSRHKWATCPRHDLSLAPVDCRPDPVFEPSLITASELSQWVAPPVADAARAAAALLPAPVRRALGGWSLVAAPMQIHAAVMAVFASLVAPFGGFFASGFKRAFKMKDFGDTIPGHGGVTDRFDCQMAMAVFAYLYYWSFVSRGEAPASVGAVLDAAQQLDAGRQLELLALLAGALLVDGALPAAAADGVRALLEHVHANVSAAAAAAVGGASGASVAGSA